MDAVDRVAPAASDVIGVDVPMHAIHLGFGDTLDVVATDKYRLHTALLPWTRAGTDGPEFVLTPASKLLAVTRGLTGDTVTLGASDSRLSLTDGTTVITTALTAAKGGGWVKWRPLFDGVNPDTGCTYRFDRDELTTAIKQAVTVADVQDGKARHLTLTVTADEMLVRAASSYSGDAAIPCPLTDYTGTDPLEWTVNADFLLTVIAAADTDPVQFTQKSAKLPIGVGAPKEPSTQIIMPIRKAV
jgi:DNA polymerase III sliding clamp (beta) subunit (PCNA family)